MDNEGNIIETITRIVNIIIASGNNNYIVTNDQKNEMIRLVGSDFGTVGIGLFVEENLGVFEKFGISHAINHDITYLGHVIKDEYGGRI